MQKKVNSTTSRAAKSEKPYEKRLPQGSVPPGLLVSSQEDLQDCILKT